METTVCCLYAKLSKSGKGGQSLLYLVLLIFLCWGSLLFGQSPLSYNLDFSSYLGAGDFEQTRNMTIDKDGYIYVTGGTSSENFPVTTGVYQEIYNGNGSPSTGGWGPMSVFVSKFSPSGELVWSTFLGGPSYDRAYAIEVSSDGLIYIGGRAGEGYPTTPGAYAETFTSVGAENGLYGEQNGFVSILSADGTELLYSTFYGGDSHGFFRDIDIDDLGHIYAIYNAARRTAPGIRPDAFDTSHNGGQFDMAAVKFSPNLDSVVWASMIGGSGKDRGGPSIRVGSDYSVFVAGGTESKDFPVTSEAVQTQFGGGRTDMFVARFTPDGTDLIYCTYFGGNDFDVSETHNLWLDDQNQAHIACGTKSTDILTTPNAIKATKTTDDLDALIFKLSADGSELLASSYFGGSGDDYSEGIFVDTQGNIYFGGTTFSTDFPITPQALQSQNQGAEEGFIVRVDTDLTSTQYATYYGGMEKDAIRAFVGNDSTIYFGGQTVSNDLLTTPGAFQEGRHTENGRADCFLGQLTLEQLSASDAQPELEALPVYPNPTADILYLPAIKNPFQCMIYNASGAKVLRNSLKNTTRIDVSHLPSGVYTLLLENDINTMYRASFIKI